LISINLSRPIIKSIFLNDMAIRRLSVVFYQTIPKPLRQQSVKHRAETKQPALSHITPHKATHQ
jgi:hypothetical protein